VYEKGCLYDRPACHSYEVVKHLNTRIRVKRLEKYYRSFVMKYIIGVMRPNFLPLAVVCAFLGISVAIWTNGSVNPWYAVLTVIGAVATHACVNAINEYDDVKSGLDYRTNRTPFSGGSGTLIQDPTKVKLGLGTALVTAGVAIAIGIFFAIKVGWPILVLGLIGLVVIFLYTPVFNKSPILCLVSPGFGFGTLIVLGTYFALTGGFSWSALLASFIPFFLVSNLLLLNQFPDVEADQTINRKHYPILIGRKASAVIFTVFTALTYVSIILGVSLEIFPIWTLLGFLSLFFAIPAVKGALQHPDDIPQLIPSLGQNVLLNLITPVLLGIGFLVG
jgi:1,4-dihydroxy-2-naphthoate octaprenyltransferase